MDMMDEKKPKKQHHPIITAHAPLPPNIPTHKLHRALLQCSCLWKQTPLRHFQTLVSYLATPLHFHGNAIKSHSKEKKRGKEGKMVDMAILARQAHVYKCVYDKKKFKNHHAITYYQCVWSKHLHLPQSIVLQYHTGQDVWLLVLLYQWAIFHQHGRINCPIKCSFFLFRSIFANLSLSLYIQSSRSH